jgi:hypothetical protein
MAKGTAEVIKDLEMGRLSWIISVNHKTQVAVSE